MDPHQVARMLAVGRMAIGTALLAAPGVVIRGMGVDDPSRGARMLARTTGARDLVLGVGTFTALEAGRDASRWVRMSAAADAVDAVAVVGARRELGPVSALGHAVLAGVAAAVGARCAAELDG